VAHSRARTSDVGLDQATTTPRGMRRDGKAAPREVVRVPIASLRPGDSPRLEGEDKAHIAWLMETQADLPPILVERQTMRVVDGMHRLLAASLKGCSTIDVEFFDGGPAEVFLQAVEANVTHGLPLSQADRRAAAARIVVSHPYLSDRAIGEISGLSAKTVAGIRQHSAAGAGQATVRVGRDGRTRPLDRDAGRRRAAELLAERPQASLREVAKAAGVSPSTVGDVRRRLWEGQEPVSTGQRRAEAIPDVVGQVKSPGPGIQPEKPTAVLTLEKLLRDPSLRHKEQGRRLLFLLQNNARGSEEWSSLIAAVPPHCLPLVSQLAHQYAQMWRNFQHELAERARVTGPWSGGVIK
jgi:transposase-like protein